MFCFVSHTPTPVMVSNGDKPPMQGMDHSKCEVHTQVFGISLRHHTRSAQATVDQAADLTMCEWPVKVRKHVPDSTLQNFADSSAEPQFVPHGQICMVSKGDKPPMQGLDHSTCEVSTQVFGDSPLRGHMFEHLRCPFRQGLRHAWQHTGLAVHTSQ